MTSTDSLPTLSRPVPRRQPDGARRPARSRNAWLAFGIWLLCCLVQLALAYGHARRGADHAVAARRAIQSAAFETSQAEVEVGQARRSFKLAHRHASSPLLAPLRVVPVLGRQLRSFTDLTQAAARVAGVASTAAEAVGTVSGNAHLNTAGRVRMLRALSDQAVSAHEALAEVRLGPRDGLVGPLRRSRALLERDVAWARASLRTAAEGLDGLATVLDGPRRYLLLAANNAEMRAGSGMFLSIGTIQTSEGSVSVGPLQPSGELTLPQPGTSVEAELGALWGWLQPGREWRNLATTPRFDVTAPLAAEMWETLTGEQVDGVLAVDVPFLAAILGATGPVEVGDGVVSQATVVDDLLHRQYEGLDVHDVQAPRRERLGAIASAVVRALDTGDYDPGPLVAGLTRASRGRHLLAWSSQPADQRTWETTGVDGSLRATSLAVGILNRGGNKLDPFLDVDAALDLRPVPDATEVTLRLNVANRAPEGQASYVAGPHPGSGVGEGDYLGIVAVNLPGAATDVAVDGAGPLVAQGPDGPTQAIAVSLLLARKQEAEVTVRFHLPPAHAAIEVVPSARTPPIWWQAGGKRWTDDAPKVVSWRWD